MTDAATLLSEFLASFEIEALGERLGSELAARALEGHPELGALSLAQLEALLGGAAAEGVAALASAAELRLRIEGPGPDPSWEALAATIENVRAALALICPPPELGPISLPERQARSAEAIERLAGIVVSWDRSLRGPPPPPGG